MSVPKLVWNGTAAMREQEVHPYRKKALEKSPRASITGWCGDLPRKLNGPEED
jgi:hypothetical protein